MNPSVNYVYAKNIQNDINRFERQLTDLQNKRTNYFQKRGKAYDDAIRTFPERRRVRREQYLEEQANIRYRYNDAWEKISKRKKEALLESMASNLNTIARNTSSLCRY